MTQKVYLKQLRPVLLERAEAMDLIFPGESGKLSHALGHSEEKRTASHHPNQQHRPCRDRLPMLTCSG